MKFICQLLRIKTLMDGALRIELDIPETEQQKVFSEILNYKNAALYCDLQVSEDRL